MPEGLVRDLSARLYGVWQENGLLVEDIVGLVSDGSVTPDEMARLNKQAAKLAEEPMMIGMFRVSETLWDGPTFDDNGELLIADSPGVLNRNAVHQAAAQLVGARGGVNLGAHQRRAAALLLRAIYVNTLKEPLPDMLANLTY